MQPKHNIQHFSLNEQTSKTCFGKLPPAETCSTSTRFAPALPYGPCAKKSIPAKRIARNQQTSHSEIRDDSEGSEPSSSTGSPFCKELFPANGFFSLQPLAKPQPEFPPIKNY